MESHQSSRCHTAGSPSNTQQGLAAKYMYRNHHYGTGFAKRGVLLLGHQVGKERIQTCLPGGAQRRNHIAQVKGKWRANWF